MSTEDSKKSFDVVINGRRYCGELEMSTKNDYATIWTTVWAGEGSIEEFKLTPSMIGFDQDGFWSCIFENKSNGRPDQLGG